MPGTSAPGSGGASGGELSRVFLWCNLGQDSTCLAALGCCLFAKFDSLVFMLILWTTPYPSSKSLFCLCQPGLVLGAKNFDPQSVHSFTRWSIYKLPNMHWMRAVLGTRILQGTTTTKSFSLKTYSGPHFLRTLSLLTFVQKSVLILSL